MDEEIIEMIIKPAATDSKIGTDNEYAGSDSAEEVAILKDSRKEARQANIQQFFISKILIENRRLGSIFIKYTVHTLF